jgi:hypothetical protein
MATSEQLEKIAARVLPDAGPDVFWRERSLFLARVMSAGNCEETNLVMEHFGKETLREVLNDPPGKIFDRESWSYWHVIYGLVPKNMPGDFFTVYPWFKDRAAERVPITSRMLADLPDYKYQRVFSVHDLNN